MTAIDHSYPGLYVSLNNGNKIFKTDDNGKERTTILNYQLITRGKNKGLKRVTYKRSKNKKPN